MKRIFFVLILVVMLSMASFVSYASASPDEHHRRPTLTPKPPTGGTLTAPVLLSPENGATVHTGNLTWSWNPVPGAARYHLQAGGGTWFDQQYNIIEYGGMTPYYTFNVTSGFIFYFPRLYWRVQAIDANGVAGPWSEVRVINLVSP